MQHACWISLSLTIALGVTGCARTPAPPTPTPNGAPVELYIAVDAKNVGPELAGPGAPPTLESTAWLPFNDIEQMHFGSPEELQRAKTDAAAYFQTRGLVVGRVGGDFHVLVHTDAARSMTRADPPDWSIAATYPVTDNLGNPAVGFQLDAAGARRLHDLSSAHVGRAVAIAVDGRVYSMPVIASTISARGIITGSFDQDEAQEIEDLIVFGERQGTINR